MRYVFIRCFYMCPYRFEKLDVWIGTTSLSKNICLVTNKSPLDEKFGLRSSLKKASISIGTNIARRLAAKTNKDKTHFTIITCSSAVDLLNQFSIAHNLNFINLKPYISLRAPIASSSNKWNA